MPLGVQLKALEKKANKVEKLKVKKDGSRMWTEVQEIGELIREGKVLPSLPPAPGGPPPLYSLTNMTSDFLSLTPRLLASPNLLSFIC